MIEKNTLEWLDMREGLEKLNIYKSKKISYIYTFFKVLLKENDFPLYFYIIFQSAFYFQLLCIINNNNSYSKDYLIYVIFYMSKLFLPQLIINNINSFRIMMIIITILLFILLFGFIFIFLGMKNDNKNNCFKSIIFIINILLQIILYYLIGPIIIICLISFNCNNGFNSLIGTVCLNKGNDIMFIILGLINIIFYLFITIIFSIFYKEIGKIGTYTPKIQINTNFELYSQIVKIIIFVLYFIYNTFLDDNIIYLIAYHAVILFILAIFTYYIYKNIFFYDKIMNTTIHLGAFLVLWFSLVQILKDIFNFNKVSLFVLIGWIIIIVLTISLFNHNSSKLILNTNIFEIDNLNEIEMLIYYILEFIKD